MNREIITNLFEILENQEYHESKQELWFYMPVIENNTQFALASDDLKMAVKTSNDKVARVLLFFLKVLIDDDEDAFFEVIDNELTDEQLEILESDPEDSYILMNLIDAFEDEIPEVQHYPQTEFTNDMPEIYDLSRIREELIYAFFDE